MLVLTIQLLINMFWKKNEIRSEAHTNDLSSLTHCMYRLNLQWVPNVTTQCLSLLILYPNENMQTRNSSTIMAKILCMQIFA